MSIQRPALGRGLSALIPQTGAGGALESVDIDLVAPNPQQPRIRFDREALEELAASILEHGVLQPIIVTRTGDQNGPMTYQLVAGERRLQAARLAGLTRIPVLIKEAAATELLELALVENIQREDLNPIEEALAYRRLADEFGHTQEQIAKRVGRGRVAVANAMRLLALEDDIRASIASGQISEGHARALLAIDDSALRLDAWRRIVADSLTVRQAEEIAKQLRATATPAKPDGRAVRHADPHLQAAEGRLREALGAKVSITKGRRAGGRITISYHSDDELTGILDRIAREG